MLTNTRSGPSTENHRSQVLLLFALLVLPALRIELKRAIKIIWIEQKGWPLHCDTSSFFKTNSSDFHLLFDFPIKDPYRRKHSRNLVDHAVQIRQFFNILSINIVIGLDNWIDLWFESWRNFRFFKNKQEKGCEEIWWSLWSCNDESLYFIS